MNIINLLWKYKYEWIYDIDKYLISDLIVIRRLCGNKIKRKNINYFLTIKIKRYSMTAG